MLERGAGATVVPRSGVERSRNGKPQEQIRLLRLGQVIRARRKGRFTVEELSEKAGVSSGLISQIERGKGNPSFKTIQRLAAALEMPISALFQDDASPLTSAETTMRDDSPDSTTIERMTVVRRDARKKLVFPKESMVWELLTPDLNRSLEMLRAVTPADYDTRDVPFVHAGEECVHVVRGTLEIHLGEHAITLNAGDTITYDASVPHWWRNVGGSEAEIISACTPPSF
jgi:transcriptional regulator with XRE-family HTH domain